MFVHRYSTYHHAIHLINWNWSDTSEKKWMKKTNKTNDTYDRNSCARLNKHEYVNNILPSPNCLFGTKIKFITIIMIQQCWKMEFPFPYLPRKKSDPIFFLVMLISICFEKPNLNKNLIQLNLICQREKFKFKWIFNFVKLKIFFFTTNHSTRIIEQRDETMMSFLKV